MIVKCAHQILEDLRIKKILKTKQCLVHQKYLVIIKKT